MKRKEEANRLIAQAVQKQQQQDEAKKRKAAAAVGASGGSQPPQKIIALQPVAVLPSAVAASASPVGTTQGMFMWRSSAPVL